MIDGGLQLILVSSSSLFLQPLFSATLAVYILSAVLVYHNTFSYKCVVLYIMEFTVNV